MQEPMKQRFKKKFRDTYYARGIIFADDTTYWSRDGRYAKRMIRRKPHSHDYGRKPRWREFRKILREFKREVRN